MPSSRHLLRGWEKPASGNFPTVFVFQALKRVDELLFYVAFGRSHWELSMDKLAETLGFACM
ncbi:MAG: hypothetical protein HC845_04255 [Akkermansiaceae bacterium]|nr:hypothetical protein [Akkermansiaceae bacterium]